jgi:hypothetical protein
MEDNTTMGNRTEGQQIAIPTLKLLQNKTHIGPVSEGVVAKASLTKAAGKIMFDNNLKITVANTGDEVGKVSDPTKKPVVKKIKLPAGNEPQTATLMMLAWDKLYGTVGTASYQNKYQEFAQMQKTTYEKLGLNLGPNSTKPELTEQQRRMYNEMMRPYAFSYYEYRLSYKQPGVKAVRSLTYRSLKPGNMDSMLTKLAEQAKNLAAKLTIETRK